MLGMLDPEEVCGRHSIASFFFVFFLDAIYGSMVGWVGRDIVAMDDMREDLLAHLFMLQGSKLSYFCLELGSFLGVTFEVFDFFAEICHFLDTRTYSGLAIGGSRVDIEVCFGCLGSGDRARSSARGR